MDKPTQERAGGEHHGTRSDLLALGRDNARNAAVLQDQVFGGGGADFQIGRRRQSRLHRAAIELAVGLGARAAHCRALALVQHAELDAGDIGHAAHDAIQRIDLADQMPLAHPANRRIAGHLADGFELVGQKQRACTHARGRRRRLAARMPPSDDNDVVAHGPGSYAGPGGSSMFHVKQWIPAAK